MNDELLKVRLRGPARHVRLLGGERRRERDERRLRRAGRPDPHSHLHARRRSGDNLVSSDSNYTN